MSIQNRELREFLIPNFMTETPKIRHDTNDNNEISIQEKKISYTDKEPQEEEENSITYKYLDDDVLSKQFSFDSEKNYKLKLCLFHIEKTNHKPYVQFYCINNKEYEFPEAILDNEEFMAEKEDETKIQVKEDANDEDEKEEGIFQKLKSVFTNFTDSVLKGDETKEQEEVENIFETQVFDFFKSATDLKVNDLNQLFRGFLEEGENIYVFFDCSTILLKNNYKLDLKEEKEFVKVLIDDIIVNKQILDVPIESEICDLFANHAFLTEIKELDESSVVNPVRCFLCKEHEDESYQNVYYEDKKNEMSLVKNKILHPEFDYLYVFTESPLNSENQNNIKSFALFVDRNIPIITETEEEIEKVKENIDDYDIIYFMKDAQKYYGVRNASYFEEL